MTLYAVTIFLSAFLLFQVQPLIAKAILPWFGGSAAVWSASMLFFQLLLLAGYAYAHVSIRFLKPRVQMIVHVALLLGSCALLPILPSPMWRPTQVGDPTARILLLLTATIGLPYFLLSSTSPLLQAWFVRRTGSGVPYRLFALSNFGVEAGGTIAERSGESSGGGVWAAGGAGVFWEFRAGVSGISGGEVGRAGGQ